MCTAGVGAGVYFVNNTDRSVVLIAAARKRALRFILVINITRQPTIIKYKRKSKTLTF